MRRSLILNSCASTTSDIEELAKATEDMRKNRVKRLAIAGDVNGYLQFLDEQQQLFPDSPGKNKLFTGSSSLL